MQNRSIKIFIFAMTGTCVACSFPATNHWCITIKDVLTLVNRNFVFSYYEALLASLLMRHNPQRILVIGLGAAVIPKALGELVPRVFIEVVEIDSEVVAVAREYFGREDKATPFLRTYVIDGRVLVKWAAELGVKYDLVILDAFNSEYIRPHLPIQEFFWSQNPSYLTTGFWPQIRFPQVIYMAMNL